MFSTTDLSPFEFNSKTFYNDLNRAIYASANFTPRQNLLIVVERLELENSHKCEQPNSSLIDSFIPDVSRRLQVKQLN